MAIFKFCKAIFQGVPIQLYNHGDMQRDFTYIDDVVEGVFRILYKPPGSGSNEGQPAEVSAPYRIYNIGNHHPVELRKLIQILETKIGRRALLQCLPMQPGDVPVTYADTAELSRTVDYHPHTSLEDGLSRFVDWYREHYKL